MSARRHARSADPADPLDRGGHDAAATTPSGPPSGRTRLATLLAGYADGLPRGAGATDAKRGGGGRDRRPPLRARRARVDGPRPSSTSPTCPRTPSRPGDPVEFFGGSIDLDDFATRSGTIGYHLLTSLGPRYQRHYVP